MSPAAEALRDHIRAIYAPADRRGVVEWSEQELFLSERQSQMPGAFSTRLTPYMRRPIECFGDADITDIVLTFGTQLGKSTILQVGTAWRIANKPTPIVWILPNEKLAKSFSETRWIPIVEDSPALRALMPSDRHKFSKLEQHFAKCSLVFLGSNSPANLASRPAGLLIVDEVDKLRLETNRETSALLLAENRTKSFAGALRVKTSTPTTPEGEIWQAYLQGSQEKYFLPCPHCGKFIELVFEQVKWSPDAKGSDGKWNMARVAETAGYKCQECGELWNDGQKIEALPRGEWRATNHMAAPGVVSFHLASIYAPWRSCSFGSLAVKFLRDIGSINGLRDFKNSTEAMPWVEPGAEIAQEDIDRRRGDYRMGTVPTTDGVILCGIDVQQAFSNYVVRAFDRDGKSWMVDYGRAATPEDVVTHLLAADYAGRKVQAGLIDSGYMTERVYTVAIAANERGLKLFPAKGTAEKFAQKPVRTTDMQLGARTFKNSLVLFSDNDFKRLLYLDCIRDGKHGWSIPMNAGPDYRDEMLRERQVSVKSARGYDEPVWKRLGPNHYADAEKLCLVWWAAR